MSGACPARGHHSKSCTEREGRVKRRGRDSQKPDSQQSSNYCLTRRAARLASCLTTSYFFVKISQKKEQKQWKKRKVTGCYTFDLKWLKT